MLNLVDLIEMSDVDLGDYKIHCAIDNKRSEWRPLEAYFAGSFDWGQSRQTQRNFECDTIISLINLSNSRRWLFVGVYSVVDVEPDVESGGFLYTLKQVAGLEHLDGR